MKGVTTSALLIAAFAAVSCSSNTSVWSNPDMWYQSGNEHDANRIDVIYFASTDVVSAKDADGNVCWQSLLVPEDRKAIGDEMSWVEKNMFQEDFNFFSPYYHQFTFDSTYQLDSVSFREVYGKVVSEACEAFDYYAEHFNDGRRFILAGFSQGAMLTLDLLKHMSDEQYSRMVACYTIGYRLSAEDLQHPHIKAAANESDSGVTISFNSVLNTDAVWPLLTVGAAACINPVNWKTDGTPASFTYKDTENTVRLDQEAQVLVVETDKPEFFHSFYNSFPVFKTAGISIDNLHHWDLQFYASNIHDNAILRAERP